MRESILQQVSSGVEIGRESAAIFWRDKGVRSLRVRKLVCCLVSLGLSSAAFLSILYLLLRSQSNGESGLIVVGGIALFLCYLIGIYYFCNAIVIYYGFATVSYVLGRLRGNNSDLTPHLSVPRRLIFKVMATTWLAAFPGRRFICYGSTMIPIYIDQHTGIWESFKLSLTIGTVPQNAGAEFRRWSQLLVTGCWIALLELGLAGTTLLLVYVQGLTILVSIPIIMMALLWVFYLDYWVTCLLISRTLQYEYEMRSADRAAIGGSGTP